MICDIYRYMEPRMCICHTNTQTDLRRGSHAYPAMNAHAEHESGTKWPHKEESRHTETFVDAKIHIGKTRETSTHFFQRGWLQAISAASYIVCCKTNKPLRRQL